MNKGNEKIFKKLNTDLEIIYRTFGKDNVFGIFSYGDGYNAEAIVIPTFEDICINEKLIDTNIITDNGLVLIRDARLIYHATKEGYGEMISALYTEDYIVNPKYEHMYIKLFRANRNEISAGALSGEPSPLLKDAVMKIMRTVLNEDSAAVRFIKKLTDVEKLALISIVQTIGDEGVFSQAKVASAIGVSRLTMTNLVGKLEEYKVAKVENLGPKGTYIKILDDTILNIRGEHYE